VASLLGKYKLLKDDKPELIIAVGGCMTQQETAAAYIKKRFHHVNLIFGTHALPRLPQLLAKAEESNQTIVDLAEDYADREGLPVSHSSNFKAWLPVIYGCNNYCSYCIVPFVRGRERSRDYESVIREAAWLAENGYLEVTLLGQNVNSYGNDLPGNHQFADLLNGINQIKGIKRIRFMTSHPKDLSKELIQAVKEGAQVCEHFHLPVQSGSNTILSRMNRRYTREHYLKLISEIRENIPGVSITSDIIVGFPGETEAEFLDTLDLLKTARFDNAFSFLYSPRANTKAETFNDQLSHTEKEERLERLNEIQHTISMEINQDLKNQILEVLAEGPSKNNEEMQTGRTRTNKLVHFPGPASLTRSLVTVKITDARTWHLTGKLEGENS